MIPAIPGVDGMTVTGEVIKARPAKEAVFKAGKGAVILNNNRIVAAISGRPLLEKGVVSVNPVMNVPGDVDVSTGNIRFDGDVVVKGDVKDGLKVIAGRDIIICGNCYHAIIKTGKNVEIRGKVINCKVTAGPNVLEHLYVRPVVVKINNELKAAIDRVATIYSQQNAQNLGQLMYRVINETTNLKTLIEHLESLLPLIEDEVATDISKLLNKIQGELLNINILQID